MSGSNTNYPTRDAPYIAPATLAQARERTREDDPCVSHLALREWERMFDAWVKHQAGLPSDAPLWPNAEWAQDIAMVAHALAGIARTEQARIDASNDANRLALRVTELTAERDRMLAMLKQVASECARCDGSGTMLVQDEPAPGWANRERVPCDECADIRRAIGEPS